MSQKTIQLNPEFLSSTKKETKKNYKRGKKTKPESLVKPNKLRKQLLAKIKDHQKRTEEKTPTTNDIEQFSNDFNNSVSYLENLSKKKNKKTKKNRNLSNTPSSTTPSQSVPSSLDIPISMELPEAMSTPILSIPTISTTSTRASTIKNRDPPYGCIKNGTKPCYREWKNIQTPINKPICIEDKPIVSETERSVKLEEIKNNFRKENPRTQKHIKTTTYKLGKTNKKVSVLIKDRGTRKCVQSEKNSLKNRKILEIKNYLREKNLLRAGSSAPNDVIRQTYENAILSGDVNNKCVGTLIHNYFN